MMKLVLLRRLEIPNVIYIGYQYVDIGVNETNRVAAFDLDSQKSEYEQVA